VPNFTLGSFDPSAITKQGGARTETISISAGLVGVATDTATGFDPTIVSDHGRLMRAGRLTETALLCDHLSKTIKAVFLVLVVDGDMAYASFNQLFRFRDSFRRGTESKAAKKCIVFANHGVGAIHYRPSRFKRAVSSAFRESMRARIWA
jgi:hypothetical protein